MRLLLRGQPARSPGCHWPLIARAPPAQPGAPASRLWRSRGAVPGARSHTSRRTCDPASSGRSSGSGSVGRCLPRWPLRAGRDGSSPAARRGRSPPRSGGSRDRRSPRGATRAAARGCDEQRPANDGQHGRAQPAQRVAIAAPALDSASQNAAQIEPITAASEDRLGHAQRRQPDQARAAGSPPGPEAGRQQVARPGPGRTSRQRRRPRSRRRSPRRGRR